MLPRKVDGVTDLLLTTFSRTNERYDAERKKVNVEAQQRNLPDKTQKRAGAVLKVPSLVRG